MPAGQTQVREATSKTKLLAQLTAVQTLLTKVKPGRQAKQTEVAVDRQMAQLATEVAQTPLSHAPLMLLNPGLHWRQWLAVSQVAQLAMAVEQRSQTLPLRKYPVRQVSQKVVADTNLQVLQLVMVVLQATQVVPTVLTVPEGQVCEHLPKLVVGSTNLTNPVAQVVQSREVRLGQTLQP